MPPREKLGHRRLGMETLEGRQVTDAALSSDVNASSVVWNGQALTADHSTESLTPQSPSRTFAIDIAAGDGSLLARGTQDGALEFYNTRTGTLVRSFPPIGTYIADITVSPDGKYVAVGTGKPDVRVYETTNFTMVRQFNTVGFVYPLTFLGDELFSSTWENKVTTVLNLKTGALRTITGGNNTANILATVDGRMFAIDHDGQKLKEINPTTGAAIRTVSMPGVGLMIASSASDVLCVTNTNGVHIMNTNFETLASYNTPNIGFMGLDTTGTRLTARDNRGNIHYLDLKDVKTTGVIKVMGTDTMTPDMSYESSVALSPDATVAYFPEATRLIAKRTPWAVTPAPIATVPEAPPVVTPPATVNAASQNVTQNVRMALEMPDELIALIAEAAQMTELDTAFRTPEANEAIITGLPTGQHLNLRGADGMTRGVQATVLGANPAMKVYAHIFRGNDEVRVVEVPANGAFTFEEDEGITDVLFRPNGKTTISVSNLQISVMPDMPVASTEPITYFTSRTFALAAAPTVQMPTNVSAAVQQLKLRGGPSGNGTKLFYAVRDPQQFTLFRITYTKGSGRISSVGTIMKTGVDYRGRETVTTSGFPEGYMQRINDNTVLIAPGAPALISFAGGFSGATGRLTMTQGASAEALMPPRTMTQSTVDVDMLSMYEQHRTEGVSAGITEIREHAAPVFAHPGHIANALYQVRNSALAGGNLTMKVYVTWYAGEPQRGTLQDTFTFGLGGGETKSVSVNVVAPSRPADATSDRPIIAAMVYLPNGTNVGNTKLGAEPTSRDVRVVMEEEAGGVSIHWVSALYSVSEQQRLATLTRRAFEELIGSTDKRMVAVRNALGADGIASMVADVVAAAAATLNASTETSTEESTTQATESAKETFAAAIEKVGKSVTPQEFMNRYLTDEGKSHFRHLLETESEIASLGTFVASTADIRPTTESHFIWIFGSAKEQLQPSDYLSGVNPDTVPPVRAYYDNFNMSDIKVYHPWTELEKQTDALVPKYNAWLELEKRTTPPVDTNHNPWLELDRRVYEQLNSKVTVDLAQLMRQSHAQLQKELTRMKREIVWAAKVAYFAANEDYREQELAALGELIATRIREFSPVMRAEGAISYNDKHNIMLDAGLMEYHPGDGRHTGKFVLLVNGHMQTLEDDVNINEVGMEYLQQKFVSEGYEVLHFRVGLAWEPFYRNPDVMRDLTEQVMFERLNKQGIFEDASTVDEIMASGYSWGGGTAASLANPLENSKFNTIPLHLALIDAVEVGYEGRVQAVKNRPAADSVFNRYETNTDFTTEELITDALMSHGNIALDYSLIVKLYKLWDEGQPAHGSALHDLREGIDNEAIEKNVTHMTIDDVNMQDPNAGENVVESAFKFLLKR